MNKQIVTRRWMMAAAVWGALMTAPAFGIQKSAYGDLQTYLKAIPVPDKSSSGFAVPGANAAMLKQTWNTAWDALMARDYSYAAGQLGLLNYDLVHYRDTVSGKPFVLVVEQWKDPNDVSKGPKNGWGTYVLNPIATRALHIQIPHLYNSGSKVGEFNMLEQGVALLRGLGIQFLSLAGTNRCANMGQATPCNGTTDACGSVDTYRISDVAHHINAPYQWTHEAITLKLPGVVAVSMHGMGYKTGDPDLMISNGGIGALTGQFDPNPYHYSLKLNKAYNDYFSANNIKADDGSLLSAKSCNTTAGLDLRYCGELNVQGRHSNGALNYCTGNCVQTAQMPGNDRFIHVEQSCGLRNYNSGCAWGKNGWEVTVAVFSQVFPAGGVVWLP